MQFIEPAGHEERCYICGDPCNGFAGNPALWPVCLPVSGAQTWHHSGCVAEKLDELRSLLEGRSIVLPIDRNHAEKMNVISEAFLNQSNK